MAMGRRLFLGIDTSNYTTSLAVASSGKVLLNLKLPLPVKEGECGLRQSDALFAHVKNIPMLADELRSALDGETPTAIGVSAKPRNIDGSYMPCFLSGVAAAEAMGAALGVPVYHFSHQCGHLRAALYSAGAEALLSRPFGAFHVSGGTTEMLLAHPKDGGFSVRLLGGTADLNAGQLVDRIGVMLGLRFPCGPALEQLATESPLPVKHKKITVKEGCVNLSGVENSARRLFDESASAPLTAAFVLDYIGDALIELSRYLRSHHGDGLPIVFAGGVMSNKRIRSSLGKTLDGVYFAEPAFSADNAAGIALLTEESYIKGDI